MTTTAGRPPGSSERYTHALVAKAKPAVRSPDSVARSGGASVFAGEVLGADHGEQLQLVYRRAARRGREEQRPLPTVFGQLPGPKGSGLQVSSSLGAKVRPRAVG